MYMRADEKGRTIYILVMLHEMTGARSIFLVPVFLEVPQPIYTHSYSYEIETFEYDYACWHNLHNSWKQKF
jgi:hypothetical protein